MIQLFNVEAASKILAISPWTVRAAVRQGKLFPVRIGRRLAFEENELQRFVNERRTAPPPQTDSLEHNI
jgi:helix-turn-helix protein